MGGIGHAGVAEAAAAFAALDARPAGHIAGRSNASKRQVQREIAAAANHVRLVPTSIGAKNRDASAEAFANDPGETIVELGRRIRERIGSQWSGGQFRNGVEV